MEYGFRLTDGGRLFPSLCLHLFRFVVCGICFYYSMFWCFFVLQHVLIGRIFFQDGIFVLNVLNVCVSVSLLCMFIYIYIRNFSQTLVNGFQTKNTGACTVKIQNSYIDLYWLCSIESMTSSTRRLKQKFPLSMTYSSHACVYSVTCIWKVHVYDSYGLRVILVFIL